MKRTPDLAVSAATIARFLIKEKHHLVHTKSFNDLMLSLAPHMGDVEAEWAAQQPAPELADEYVSLKLAELLKSEQAFAERHAQAARSNKIALDKIKAALDDLDVDNFCGRYDHSFGD